MLSDAPSNTHTIFVDSAEEGERDPVVARAPFPFPTHFTVAKFDPAKHFDTAPELMPRSYNRPTLQQLTSAPLDHTPEVLEAVGRRSGASYRELKRRIHRSDELRRLAQKMKTQKDLMVRCGDLKMCPYQRGVLISEGGMYRLQWSWDLKMCPY